MRRRALQAAGPVFGLRSLPAGWDGSRRRSFQRKARKGYDRRCADGDSCARGDVLMLLDAHPAPPPEALPAVYQGFAVGTGEFINGMRVVRSYRSRAAQLLVSLPTEILRRSFPGRSTDASRTSRAAPRCRVPLSPDRGQSLVFRCLRTQSEMVEALVRHASRG